MTDDQKTTIKGYVTTFDNTIAEGDVLDLVVDTVADRVLLYLNTTEIAANLERIIAQIVVTVYKRNEAKEAGLDKSVSSISDNGQSVSYHLRTTQFMASTSDEELFSGFERLLSQHRRVNVIAS